MNIFQTRSMISIRYGENENWMLNSIKSIEIENDIIEMLINIEYINKVIMKGDNVDIKVGFIDDIYTAVGNVEEIILDLPQSVKIKIKSIKKLEDKREEIRYHVNLNSLIKGKNIDGVDFSVVTNISKSGIGIISKENFSIGINIFIDIFINENVCLKLKGTSIRKTIRGRNIEYGLVTTPVDTANKEILNKYLEGLEEKERVMISTIKKIKNGIEKDK